jgi:putative phosphoesterase
MKLGILSDTHNDEDSVRDALRVMGANQVEELIHCGDITKARTVRMFEGWRVAFVFGNVDRKHDKLTKAVRETRGSHHIGPSYEAEIDGVRVGACHGHDLGLLREMIEGGRFDLVCHGHTHHRRDEMVGKTRVVNPGALGGKLDESRSVCIYDTETGEARFIDLGW